VTVVATTNPLTTWSSQRTIANSFPGDFSPFKPVARLAGSSDVQIRTDLNALYILERGRLLLAMHRLAMRCGGNEATPQKYDGQGRRQLC
jgi:hypothetical protein